MYISGSGANICSTTLYLTAAPQQQPPYTRQQTNTPVHFTLPVTVTTYRCTAMPSMTSLSTWVRFMVRTCPPSSQILVSSRTTGTDCPSNSAHTRHTSRKGRYRVAIPIVHRLTVAHERRELRARLCAHHFHRLGPVVHVGLLAPLGKLRRLAITHTTHSRGHRPQATTGQRRRRSSAVVVGTNVESFLPVYSSDGAK